jgi:hypothetical protein
MKRIFIMLLILVLPVVSIAKLPASCEVEVNQLVHDYMAQNTTLRPQVLRLALESYECALQRGIKDKKKILTIIDYSLPSSVRRMWVLDLKKETVLFNTLVAHGKYSGELRSIRFSDKPGSLESSIGLFVTGKTYYGHDGYTLRLIGLEKGFNDKAEARHIVMHGAWYVSKAAIQHHGTIGRSWGCPALDEKIIRPVIDMVKDGTILFAYYPQRKWLRTSTYLNCPKVKSARGSSTIRQWSP